jgi:hypothetical protein
MGKWTGYSLGNASKILAGKRGKQLSQTPVAFVGFTNM